MSGLGHVSWKGWAALATFALQNGLAVIIMRYSKVRQNESYSSQVAVLMQEVAVKLPISMLLYALECGGLLSAGRSIMNDLRERPMEWAQLAVPALLYTVQNTLLYVGYANVEAAVGQVTYQSKILWTALFSVIILSKKLNANQWLALVVLAAGVLAVQGMGGTQQSNKSNGQRMLRRISRPNEERVPALEAAMPEQSPMLGIGALVGAAVCTSFASVYFEKMLKGASKPSLWLRNIQLAIYCSLTALCGIFLARDESLARRGWLAGFSLATWLSVTWQALGGIIVAITIKYADNILRGFAQGLALIVGALGSWLIFDFHISLTFMLGVTLVMSAIFLYGSSGQRPHELCEMLCATWAGGTASVSVSPASLEASQSLSLLTCSSNR